MSHTRLLVASWSLALLCSNAGCDADKFTLADGAAGEDDGGSGDGGATDAGPACGNGNKDDGEMCDPADDLCCNDTCDGVKAPGDTCRASTGACDEEETCNGTSVICPVDSIEPDTTVCRPVAGPCDVAESCNGTSGACPADTFVADTTECRASEGVCDAAENCSGTAAACPADALSTAVCRASTGMCDPAESCTGDSLDCPAEQPPCDITDLGSTFPVSASGTTTDGCNLVTPSCDTTSTAPEKWFSFTAPTDGLYEVTVDATAGWDTVIYRLDSVTCGGTELDCNDDGTYNSSQLVLTLTADTTVVIAVDGYAANMGDFEITVAQWTCDVTYYGDAGCDCGCGIVDSDCADNTSASCSSWCNNVGSCDELSVATCANIRPSDNSTCRAWTCDAGYDAGDGCDCGCEIPDPDCAGPTPASCNECGGAGSCSPTGTCADLQGADNSLCRPWTCDADFQGMGDGCDCGCGQIDPDCGSEASSECLFCNNDPGSCAIGLVDDCTTIAPTNNAICL